MFQRSDADGSQREQDPTPSKRKKATPETKSVRKPPSRIVRLLVGGREHMTTRQTLSMVPGSFLDRLISQDEHGMKANQDDDGRFFIDRDGDMLSPQRWGP